MVYNKVREELVKQAVRTIRTNTKHYSELFLKEDDARGFHKLNYIKLRNDIVSDISYVWEYIVFVDDDLYFNKGWLEAMIIAYNNNPDVWVLSTTKWRNHTLVEKREDVSIMEQFAGGCIIMSKYVWDKCGPFKIDLKKTIIFWEKVHEQGGKVAVLNDEMKVIHCGVKGIINKRGKSPGSEKIIQDLANKVNAKTNRSQKIY